MQLNIPPHEFEQLARHAAAAGFASVETYVTQFVIQLAQRPEADKLLAPLTDAELAASLATIDRSMAEIDAGQGLALHEARRQSLEKLGFANE